MKYIYKASCVAVAFAISTLSFGFAHAAEVVASRSEATANVNVRVPSSLLQIASQSAYYSPYAFVVDKKSRTLTVWHQDGQNLKPVASFPADMGKNDGDKRSSGDQKTPNGIYFLQDKYEGANLEFKTYGKLAFTTDYPNFFDRMDGKTGHGIWLHAVPDQVALTRGSRGCVVVRNEVISNLSQYVHLQKTPIIIQDEVELLDSEKNRATGEQLTKAIEDWRAAWEKKDIENYIAFYGPSFRSQKMGRDQWKAFKAHLNESYETLGVKLSRPVIYAYRNRAVARFLQSYTSDQHADFGEKTLYLVNAGDGYKIVGEDWRADNSKLAQEEFNSQPATSTAKNNAMNNAAVPANAQSTADSKN